MSDDPNGAIEPTAGDVPLVMRNIGPGDNDYGRKTIPTRTTAMLADYAKLPAELDALRKIKEAAKLVSDNHFLGIANTNRDWRKDHETLRDLLADCP